MPLLINFFAINVVILLQSHCGEAGKYTVFSPRTFLLLCSFCNINRATKVSPFGKIMYIFFLHNGPANHNSA